MRFATHSPDWLCQRTLRMYAFRKHFLAPVPCSLLPQQLPLLGREICSALCREEVQQNVKHRLVHKKLKRVGFVLEGKNGSSGTGKMLTLRTSLMTCMLPVLFRCPSLRCCQYESKFVWPVRLLPSPIWKKSGTKCPLGHLGIYLQLYILRTIAEKWLNISEYNDNNLRIDDGSSKWR